MSPYIRSGQIIIIGIPIIQMRQIYLFFVEAKSGSNLAPQIPGSKGPKGQAWMPEVLIGPHTLSKYVLS